MEQDHINKTSYSLDLRKFAQCRTCCEPMIGILSILAREDCVGCGGVALNAEHEITQKEA